MNSERNKTAKQRLSILFKSVWGSKIFKTLLAVLVIVIVALAAILINFKLQNRGKSPKYGATFSTKYAEELGIDQRQSYQAIVSDLGLNTVRTMSYWDEHEATRDQYQFKQLDWQFAQAQKHNVDVSLAIGYKQPRWPECHQPAWARGLGEEEWQGELMEYLKVVVNRYKDHPALESWQLENEADLRLFGDCRKFIEDRIEEEANLVKRLDPKHPLIMNYSQSRIPFYTPADKVGFSVYKDAHFEMFGRQWSWSYWYIPSWWHGLRAAIVELDGHDTLIVELQAEPWGPRPTVQLSQEQQLKYMDAQKLRRNAKYARATGMNEIHFWGAEWWYWQKEHFGNDELWQAVQDITR